MSGCRVEIDLNATVIEVYSHVRITLRRLDHSGVERGTPDRVYALGRIDIVRREMQRAGFIVDHAATHRDRVLQDLIGDAKLLKRVNPARRNSEINRASAYNVAFARIGTPLIKIVIVSAPAQIGRQQSACQAAADKYEFRWHSPEFLTADYADITDFQIKQLAQSLPKTRSIVA